ncbi:MAG: BMP family ABC transporter substrate-binding protein [Candidatus Heimdallarchaeota archaeon]|nr:MAG: BMP family ABC transporter substrate-binding protein [Candidatus Heimdallarchaeota archaeon]
MKYQHKKILLVIVLLFCFVSTSFDVALPQQGTASSNQAIRNIAVILDSPELYDSSFINDVLNGFDLVNQTYNMNYTVFPLTKYSRPPITYYYDGTQTNHTELADQLAQTDQYDLVVLMGYELRREKKANYLPERYPDTKFLFYDLSGQVPSYLGNTLGDNAAVFSFNESHVGFIAGTLTAETISPTPEKIAMVCTYRNTWPSEISNPKSDPRSWQLISGFQSGFLRNTTEVDISIYYVDYFWESWTDSDKAKKLAEDLDKQGYDLIFSALQNNNTLGILEGFTNTVVTVDSNRTSVPSVVKNNTKAILTLFEKFNRSEDNFPGIHSLGLEENVFYPSGWGNVTKNMERIYTDIVVNKIVIPTDIKHAENTNGFEILAIISIILYIPIRKKKKR